jgi:HD-GYP domain-containing protein (c-di-GMP phosphodiesterase class II)
MNFEERQQEFDQRVVESFKRVLDHIARLSAITLTLAQVIKIQEERLSYLEYLADQPLPDEE